MPSFGDKLPPKAEADALYDAAGITVFRKEFREHYVALVNTVLERAAQEADRGYLYSENCDDIAKRIRALKEES